jgi:acetyl-CoA C-acetyltransferase
VQCGSAGAVFAPQNAVPHHRAWQVEGRIGHFRFDSKGGKGKKIAKSEPTLPKPEKKMPAANAIVVASAARTPVGSFNGAFANTPAHELGAAVIREVLSRAGVDAREVDEVILGQILTAAQGQNPARQAAMAAGIPQEATAWGLNQLCGSGLRTIAVGMQQIATGDAKIIVAGGQESMSMAPHAQHLRGGTKMGDLKLIDTMLKDGLTDAFNGYHMGNTAENVARKWQLTRDDQDRFAVASQI